MRPAECDPVVGAIPADGTGNRCILETATAPGSPMAPGTIICLHDENSTHVDILGLLRKVSTGQRLISPRSARWSRFGGGGRFSWFSCANPPAIEPIGFGDSLIQLERLMLDCDAQGLGERTVTLIGIGQGATMALALAMLWPELCTNVVAIGGSLPVVPGWSPLAREMPGLPVLLIAGDDDTQQKLGERGARVVAMAACDEAALAATIQQWMSVDFHLDQPRM